MLSPIAELSLQIRNRAPTFGFAATNGQFRASFTIFVRNRQTLCLFRGCCLEKQFCSAAFLILVLKRQSGFPNRQFCSQNRGLGPKWGFLCPDAKSCPQILTCSQERQIGITKAKLGTR